MASYLLPPPAPLHLLRVHNAQVNALFFSEENERLYSGDASGFVIVTSTRSLRSITEWKAHSDGILGVQEWGDKIITHARDNKLHVWKQVETPPSLGGSAALPSLPQPAIEYSMDVNALNYCRFSLLPICLNEPGPSKAATIEQQALLVVPNLVESECADVWILPTRERLHAAIGKGKFASSPDSQGRKNTGIIMSMHLFESSSSDPSAASNLRLLCAYEDGGVIMWSCTASKGEKSIEGRGWDVLWASKLHAETVMALAISPDRTQALSVSADHLVGRYDLSEAEKPNFSASTCFTVHRTKHPGNASLAYRSDGRVCAIGGWDGKVRLYSTKTLKSLGSLSYHKNGCQAVALANAVSRPFSRPTQDGERHQTDGHDQTDDKDEDGHLRYDGHGHGEDSEDDDDDDDYSLDEKAARSRWLAAGSRDNRISIWALSSFEKTSKT